MPQTTLKLVKLYHITTSCFVLLITSLAAQDSLPVRFEENSIIPDDEMFLTDNSKDTCTLFKLDDDEAEVGKRTKFRISIPELVLDEVAVSMIGSNMGCDRDLYLMPLSPNETLKWRGCWPICPLIKSARSGNEEKCRFECQCSGRCKEIQVIRKPYSIQDSSWSVCEMTLRYKAVPTSCTYFSSQQSGIYEYVIADTPNLIRREFYCDSNIDGGGWTVLMRRQDGSVDFNRDWHEYKVGFGSMDDEFWIGNDVIHQLTNNGRTYTLRIDMITAQHKILFLKYRSFSVGPESDKYRLRISGYDKSSNTYDYMTYHDNALFCTSNDDNDEISMSLARFLEAPFWYRELTQMSITRYYDDMYLYVDYEKVNLKFAVMMIRPN